MPLLEALILALQSPDHVRRIFLALTLINGNSHVLCRGISTRSCELAWDQHCIAFEEWYQHVKRDRSSNACQSHPDRPFGAFRVQVLAAAAAILRVSFPGLRDGLGIEFGNILPQAVFEDVELLLLTKLSFRDLQRDLATELCILSLIRDQHDTCAEVEVNTVRKASQIPDTFAALCGSASGCCVPKPRAA